MEMLDHLGIGVADYERSKGFYEKALAPLGYRLLMEFSGAAAGFGQDDSGRASVVLRARGEAARGGPPSFLGGHGEPARGRLHTAFGAESRELVDAFHAAALEAGGTDNGAPGIRWYHDDYYGGYVLDPDGHNVEAVCHKPA